MVKKPKEDDSLKIECEFQTVPCEYRGRYGICQIDDMEPNQRCPAGE